MCFGVREYSHEVGNCIEEIKSGNWIPNEEPQCILDTPRHTTVYSRFESNRFSRRVMARVRITRDRALRDRWATIVVQCASQLWPHSALHRLVL